jgi:Anthrone oxygenase
MMMGLLALTAAAIFTGAAVYVNVAEQPARLTLDDRALLTEWKPSYKRGFAMQAPLALLGCVFGLIAWWQTSHAGFLMGAFAIFAPWPWTILGIKPTNDALLEMEIEKAGAHRPVGQSPRSSHRPRRARNACIPVGKCAALGAHANRPAQRNLAR